MQEGIYNVCEETLRTGGLHIIAPRLDRLLAEGDAGFLRSDGDPMIRLCG